MNKKIELLIIDAHRSFIDTLFRFPILFRENGYEAIMRSHAVLRGFRHDLGLDIADNLFSCDYGGSAYDRGI